MNLDGEVTFKGQGSITIVGSCTMKAGTGRSGRTGRTCTIDLDGDCVVTLKPPLLPPCPTKEVIDLIDSDDEQLYEKLQQTSISSQDDLMKAAL